MSQIIKTSFGFGSIFIGNLVVYTCKVRLKGHNLDLGVLHLLAYNKDIRIKEFKQHRKATKLNIAYDDCITEIAYEQTNPVINATFKRAIGRELRKIAQKRLDEKYAYCNDYK